MSPEFFASDVSADVVANLIFGLFESDGHVSLEQTGAVRVGYTTTSEQLAHQLHWLLLRWGIGSSVRRYDPSNRRPSIVKGRKVLGKLPRWEVRVSGIENVQRFAEVIPMWGPRGKALVDRPRRSRTRRPSRLAAQLPAQLADRTRVGVLAGARCDTALSGDARR